MGGKIDAYVDCVSPYSLYAFEYLIRNRDVLSSHGVEIEFHPVFLGGIVEATGNRPPFTIPAKAAYGKNFDGPRTAKFFGVESRGAPPFFPILSLLSQRVLTHLKSTLPQLAYESILRTLFHALQISHIDISKSEHLTLVLASILPTLPSSSNLTPESILTAASSPPVKSRLASTTKHALDLGAFGTPWFWVTRDIDGKGEPFFGSDRFAFMMLFLGVPVQEFRILGRGELKEEANREAEEGVKVGAKL